MSERSVEERLSAVEAVAHPPQPVVTGAEFDAYKADMQQVLRRVRTALWACAENIQETGTWGMVALSQTRAALDALDSVIEQQGSD